MDSMETIFWTQYILFRSHAQFGGVELTLAGIDTIYKKRKITRNTSALTGLHRNCPL